MEHSWNGTGHSGTVVEWIFSQYILGTIPETPITVLDLTFGNGTFWDWDHDEKDVVIVGNDAYAEDPGITHQEDFQSTKFIDQCACVVVFDPPFTAGGTSNKGNPRHLQHYGALRSIAGGPKNIYEVQALLRGGIREACRLSRSYVIVKTQDVVESGVLHGSVNLALNTIKKSGFDILLQVRFLPHRRPQPKKRRVTGLGNQPSVFILAERTPGNRPPDRPTAH